MTRILNSHEDDVSGPKVEECGHGSEGLHDVGVVAARLGYGGAEVGVAESADHGEEAAHAPHDQRETHRSSFLDDALGSDEDACKKKEK